jgi:hypothetical protein
MYDAPMMPLALALAAMFIAQPPEASEVQPLTKLDAALEQVGSEEASATIAALDAALAEIAKQPQLAYDEASQAKLLEARVALAWLHLASGEQDEAAAAMDDALRTARGRDLEPGNFGPAILELHDARKAALAEAGSGSIEVECEVPCTVIVNEQVADNPVAGLALGGYRVWISASEGDPNWVFHEVELGAAGGTERLRFERPETVAVTIPEPIDVPQTKPKRMLPRWAEIVGMTAGLGLAAGGAVFLALNGKCKGGGDPATCPQIYDNTIQAASLLAAGGAVFVTFGALLIVDEVRVGRMKGQQATLVWTMRF